MTITDSQACDTASRHLREQQQQYSNVQQTSSTPHLEENVLWEAKLSALHDAFSGPHPVDVASEGVDLPIVPYHAHRLGPAPAREGVGAEAGVHQRHVGLELWMLQVLEIGGDLRAGNTTEAYLKMS